MLARMGITVWRERASLAPEPAAQAQPVVQKEPTRTDGRIWDEIEGQVSQCTACALHRTRRRTVFGCGAHRADWLIVGEAPGANEDRLGEPFVGRAGKLLDAMLFALGLERDAVFITNTVKCRPPANRDPAPEETQACRHFLDRQIALVEPRVILAAGRVAAQILLESGQSLAKMRGTVHRLPGTQTALVATYHPAYLLRKPIDKRKSWADLCLARSVVRQGR